MKHVLVRSAPGALAAAAVLSFGAFAPASAVDCGTPAQPAVYQTVVHPAVTQLVSAVTHDAWLWSRDVTTTEREVGRTTPGHDVIRWSRTVPGTVELEYAETVVDQAAVPAVPAILEQGHFETVVVTPAVTMTLWEYQQLITGMTRWEKEGWNAGPNGKGWSATGATDDVVVTPAVTEQHWVVDVPATPGSPAVDAVTHVALHWLAEGSTPPAGWSATGKSRGDAASTQTVDLPEGQAPDGDGWEPGEVVDSVAPVVDLQWIGELDAVPAGYQPTGETRTDTSTETTSDPTTTAPAGDGWAKVAASVVTVVDEAAKLVVLAPAWDEQVLVTPAVDAGPPCVDPPRVDPPVVVPPVVDPPVVDPPVVDPPVVSPPVVSPPVVEVATPSVQPPAAAAAPVDAVLPNTGGGSPWVPALGVSVLVAGIALMRRSVRRA